MTVPDVPSWLDRWMSRLILFTVIATCLCFVAIGYQQLQVRSLANQGADARARQMKVYPVSVKVYEAAWRRGDITLAELNCFRTGRGCPVDPSKSP